MAKQGDGYWIDGRTGRITKVRRHEEWPYEGDNLKQFGLERIKPALDELKPIVLHQDEIRIVLLQSGLVRTRNNQGMISIQFYCDKSRVKDFLYNTAAALKSVNEYGTNVWIHNLKYDDSTTVDWNQFLRGAEASQELLAISDEKEITDIPYNSALLEKVERRLRMLDLDK